MGTEKDIINDLKLNFYELSLLFDVYNRQTVMEMFTRRLQTVLNTSHIELLTFNRWNVQGECNHYTHHSKKQLNPLNNEVFMKYYNDKLAINLVDESDNFVNDFKKDHSYLLKLHCKEKFLGFLYVIFNHRLATTISFLEKIGNEIMNFLTIFYNHRDHRYLNQREKLLFELSTTLHSIHRTDDLLREVLVSIEHLFPTFDFTFLMSNEYEDSNLPIKFIEYEARKPLSAGIKAFINNKLEITKNREKKLTTFYVPIGGEQSVYGVIKGEAPYIIELSESDTNFIEQSAKMIGKALERTILYQESTNKIADLQLINQTTHRLNSNLNCEEIISIVKDKIYYSCHPENVVAIIYDDKGEKPTLINDQSVYFHSLSGQVLINYVRDEMNETGEALFLGDLQQEELDIPFKSLMAFPLQTTHDLIGLIIIVHSKPYYFSFDRFKLIQTIVQHASLALSNTLLKEQLKKSVITDYLTQLYSRSYLDTIIAEHMESGEIASFILFDIDNFKLVNDTYGHYVGDKVLKKIARIIEEVTDDIGVAARWGGEEFAIYLPDKNIDDAVKIADILREKVKNYTDPQVSISCGVSMWKKSLNEDIKGLFVRTDMALYKAKGSGKNKVIQMCLDTNK